MKRAALYARVSTKQQEQEETIQSQLAVLQAFAQEHTYQVFPDHVFIDEAVSGARLDRPGLDRLRDQAMIQAFDVVLILSPDRLARQGAHLSLVVEELRRCQIEVVFVNHPVSDDPLGNMILQIQGAVAEYERVLITERLRRGRLHAARQGKMVNVAAPYGYRYVLKSEPGGPAWVIVEAEAEIVRLIFQWCVEEHLTGRQIARRLTEERQVKTRHGKRWQHNSIVSILTQPAYTGKAVYNRTQGDPTPRPRLIGRGLKQEPTRTARPQEEWIEIAVPTIVCQETWDLAQEELARHRRYATRNNRRQFYLLRGLLVCSHCGRTLVGHTRYGRRYYYCTNRGYECTLSENCPLPALHADEVESVVWEAVQGLLANPQLILDYYLTGQDSPPGSGEQEQTSLENKLKGSDRQLQRLLDAYQEGAIELSQLQERRQRLDEQRRLYTARQKEVADLVQQRKRREALAGDLEEICHRIVKVLQCATPEEKQQVLRLVVEHIVVEEGRLIVKHIFPPPDDVRLWTRRR